LIAANDSFNTLDLGQYYAILPSSEELDIEKYREHWKGTAVQQDFEFNSRDNPIYLTVDELRAEIRSQVDPVFEWRT
jgi:UDP-N-acetylglucosamine 4,6-dehydratase